MRSYVLVLAAPLMLAAPAFAQSQSGGNDAKQFLDFAAQSNQSEIQAGLAAEKKAQAPAVKAFARLMAMDHMALQSQLDAAATQEKVQLPSGPSDTAKQQMAKLQSMSGEQYDTTFVSGEVKDHEQAIQRFQTEKSNAQNPTVKALATGALPILQQHLALAQMIEQSLKSPSAASTPSPTVGAGSHQR